MANPFTGERLPDDRHWSAIDDFGGGDVKGVWELSRFGFAFALVRAYWRTGDDAHAETFWRLVEDWRLCNPPQTGPNWKCGQEASFRLMAWCFALYGFLEAPCSTAERVWELAEMVAVTAGRIEANLAYALSQDNNHGISEGAGLWTAGLLFPELRGAARWAATGERVLEDQAQRLIYPDGGFSQHSVNYHRVMLHDYLWALRLGDVAGRPLSAELRARVLQAGGWLRALQDAVSGQGPRYGPDDGALVLPLNECAYADLRPATQAAYFAATGRRWHPSGPWDEDLLWLYGPAALCAPMEAHPTSVIPAAGSTYHVLRSGSGLAFTRCGAFRHRPGHADLLHADVWWKGINVALDPGTYSYNAPPPWDGAMAETTFHNTVTVDGRDQMERVSRFLWLPWARGRVLCDLRPPDAPLAYWEGEHDGYLRLSSPVTHRRGILRVGEEHWLVVDGLTAEGPHTYRLNWLLGDFPHRFDPGARALELQTPEGPYGLCWAAWPHDGVSSSLVRADPSSPRGWCSPHYLTKEPALSLEVQAVGTERMFASLLGPTPLALELSGGRVVAKAGEMHLDLVLGHATGDGSLVRSAAARGPAPFTLEIP
jgi:asparagine synthase (glutamine-hydrolysing)